MRFNFFTRQKTIAPDFRTELTEAKYSPMFDDDDPASGEAPAGDSINRGNLSFDLFVGTPKRLQRKNLK